ncbi:MAG: hypothetical protein COV31_01780 [Candidatus Yanofskybacteria bacterium CG10_big_fil_rev_8_21_14_0_10_46_23]|uniref:Uncharacterized protein n=1 Tax=Candidatus Yanofskybacteria bacterium CG10_big_fil_rev_8_21_14_0_10_46_23 TaxID=1975098 RepID=A0A2H0R4A2_9BACT|nr:MAG: hypothetical protein COV31_01780 [Candidatus Yanofskybacteria bacterium CG10_big_fil_rev_8_21_14_0_10_46_23]
MNKELKRIFDADQRDRLNPPKRFSSGRFDDFLYWLDARDKKRLKRTKEIIKRKDLVGEDYHRAAMIFHHIGDIKIATSLANKSIDMGYEKARWLYAATVDRGLVMKGRKQKYGTQFKVLKDGSVKFYPINKRTPESEKKKYNVPPPEEIARRSKRFWRNK